MATIRWGILGLGSIAEEFADALGRTGGMLAAVGSRSEEKSRAFAAKWRAKSAHGSYADLLENPDVDVIYVATPHNSHYLWARECLLHGKHVLCEKAITVNGQELGELCSLAASRRLLLKEAMTVYHMPLYQELLSRIGESAPLGRVKALQIAFGSMKPYDVTSRYFNPDLAGGALLDIGVYALSFARLFLSCQPDRVLTTMSRFETGVDEQSGILLQNAMGELAVITLAMRAKFPKRAVISCERGFVSVDDYPRADSAAITWAEDGRGETIRAGAAADALAYEVQQTERLIASGASDTALALTCDVMSLMDQIRASWGLRYPFEG